MGRKEGKDAEETKMQEWKCRIYLQYCDEVLSIVGVTKEDIELKNRFN